MPNPVPLATKEEEERRAWVTAHHEVVRLVKDCFGDRFSNNEIFERLKISRRTGYRALGNDERIGKAPGRKPKLTDTVIRDMIDYIEAGGCADVGNVWRHLAERFAPHCNPKTVQDAVKKSGFKNYRDSVKLEPLLAAAINLDGTSATGISTGRLAMVAPADGRGLEDEQPAGVDPVLAAGSPAQNDEQRQRQRQRQQQQQHEMQMQMHHQLQQIREEDIQRRQQQQQGHQDAHSNPAASPDSNIDPSFSNSNSHHHIHQQPQEQQHQQQHQSQQTVHATSDALRTAIDASSDHLLRYTLSDICHRYPEAAQLASSYLIYVPSQPLLDHESPLPPSTSSAVHSHIESHAAHLPSQLSSTPSQQTHPGLQSPNGTHTQAHAHTHAPDHLTDPQKIRILPDATRPQKRTRIALCRRCGRHYDRSENTMMNRLCLYHKGSPQRISPETTGTIMQTPEAFIWSCCGGNGSVRGCCRAMHTSKKKRTYGKKRDSIAAGIVDRNHSSRDGDLLTGITLNDAALGMHVDTDDVDLGVHVDVGSTMGVDISVDAETAMLSVAAAARMQNHNAHFRQGLPNSQTNDHNPPAATDRVPDGDQSLRGFTDTPNPEPANQLDKEGEDLDAARDNGPNLHDDVESSSLHDLELPAEAVSQKRQHRCPQDAHPPSPELSKAHAHSVANATHAPNHEHGYADEPRRALNDRQEQHVYLTTDEPETLAMCIDVDVGDLIDDTSTAVLPRPLTSSSGKDDDSAQSRDHGQMIEVQDDSVDMLVDEDFDPSIKGLLTSHSRHVDTV